MATVKDRARKLALLMWKHYYLRRNRWILSLTEIFLPILIVYILAKNADSIVKSDGVIRHNATIENAIPASAMYDNARLFTEIIYTPATADLAKFMNTVVQIINIPLQAVENETSLERLLSVNATFKVGIVFEDTSALHSESGHLRYKIRDANDWFIDKLFEDQDKGPVNSDIYRNKGYAGLQLALNKAFLGDSIPNPYEKVLIQAFPYPEYNTENDMRRLIPIVVCGVVIFTILKLSIPLISAVIEEKESGVKELMKMVGLEEWLVWIGWFFHALVVSVFSFTVVTYMLQHEYAGPHSAAIRYVDPTVLWSSIILYCIANTAFCFTFASIFHQATIASSIFVLVQILIAYASLSIADWKSLYLCRLGCLFPISAFIQGFGRIQYLELHDIPLTWSNLNSSERNSISISMGFMFLMLMFDTLLYLFLAFYFSAINPGKFGAKKSPFFIFERLRSKFGDHSTQELVNLEDPSEDRYMEKAPANLETTIRIKDLHKNFGSVFAVKGVNLNVYKGEITALLGHNGAGKTTTLAILTGLIKPTEGSIIYKNELDVLKRMDQFRKKLGMCPQEDRLFPYLSVKNHLIFFGMLKGQSREEASQEAAEYMRLMEIDGKANSLVSDLSGGMKRKLCLSIALMGKAETLILDEPTSGLDVESRRKLWDLLLEMRGNRTIILTTHHMEEADALGDRIAIMNHGAIVCHGTSLFLKKSYGTGYQLTITKRQNASTDAITDALTLDTNVSDVVLECSSATEVVYKLPLTETSKFPTLFRSLEQKTSELGVENVGVSCTTMEQVFLKVGGVSIYDSAAGLSRKNSTVTDGAALANAEKKKAGLSLIVQQIQALMFKKWLYTSRNWLTFVFRVLLPSFLLLSLLHGTKEFNYSTKPLTVSLATYPNAHAMVQNNTSPIEFTKFLQYLHSYGDDEIQSTENDIVEGLLQYGRQNLASFQRELPFAIEFNDTSSVLLYNKYATHSLPIMINSYTNVLLLAHNKSIDVTMINQPINSAKDTDGNDTTFIVLLTSWFLALVFFSVDLNTYFLTSLNVERIDGFKHIQLMSNVSPLTYWFCNFLFDVLFYLAILMMRIIILKIFGDEYNFLSFDSHFAVLTFILIIFAAGCVLFSYVLSHLSGSKDGSYVLLFILNCLGALVVSVFYLFQSLIPVNSTGYTFWEIIYRLVKYVVMLMPPLNYSLIFIKFFHIWYGNTACIRNPITAKCEDKPYLVFASMNNPDGILEEVIYMVFDIILYSALLSVIQMGYLEKMWNSAVTRLCNYPVYEDDPSSIGDEDVQLEKAKVQRLATEQSGRTNEFVLVTRGLRKNFFKLFRPFTAVADVNFTIKPGECFGLLGVNGAGKSTTFRMLTADLLPTEGDSSLLGIHLSTNKSEYLSKAGYCAQSNCFLEELTGREMLTLIASLRGIHSDGIKNMVDKWLSILGLEEYQNQYCGRYSGGNKRKLCTAMSLIGEPSAVFLDEPTSGVDPVSRRRLYAVMDQSKSSGQAVILTSHSMEECENLCDRLTILVKGRMRCIGTAQHLKKTYAQGFSILIKIVDTANEDSLLHLKRAVETEFQGQCVLKDQHKTQLYYQITNVYLLWSTLFEKMEKLKNENTEIIDDYSLSDTSLEEVFIAFAKQQINNY